MALGTTQLLTLADGYRGKTGTSHKQKTIPFNVSEVYTWFISLFIHLFCTALMTWRGTVTPA